MILKPGHNQFDTQRHLKDPSIESELVGQYKTIDSSAAGAFDLKNLKKRNDGNA